MNKISKWVVILCFVSSFAFSQNTNLFFTHISQDAGFPNVSVNCMLQDRYGYLWLGTTQGLFKYNGYSFTRYGFSAKDPTTISDNFINCIVEDSDGDLLIGTNGRGLCIYHRNKNQFERFSHDDRVSTSLINNTVKTIFQDSRGNVWVGTLGGGIDIFNKQKKTFKHLTPPGSAHNEIHVSSFAEDKNGNVWVGRYKGDLCFYKSIQDKFVYVKVVRLTESQENDGTREEFVLRFFAFLNNYVYGVIEYTVYNSVAKTINFINADALKIEELKPLILSLALNDQLDALINVTTKKWHKRLAVFQHLTDNTVVNIASDLMPTDGRNVRYAQLESIWKVFCITDPILHDIRFGGRLKDRGQSKQHCSRQDESLGSWVARQF